MTDARRENPEVDAPNAIGCSSPEDRALRLACLREARRQLPHGSLGDHLYRARHNARFVLLGETPTLRLVPEQETNGD